MVLVPCSRFGAVAATGATVPTALGTAADKGFPDDSFGFRDSSYKQKKGYSNKDHRNILPHNGESSGSQERKWNGTRQWYMSSAPTYVGARMAASILGKSS